MSMGEMPWAWMAAMCAGLPRMARMPPAMVGCKVLTRPSSISGNPVTSLTSATGMPASRIRRAVPPVEMSSAPMAARAEANSRMPVLSVTLSSTREIFAIYWHDNTRHGCATINRQRLPWGKPGTATLFSAKCAENRVAVPVCGLHGALAASQFQRIGFGVAPVLVDLGKEFGGLGQVAGELAEGLDLVAQDVVAEALGVQAVGLEVGDDAL